MNGQMDCTHPVEVNLNAFRAKVLEERKSRSRGSAVIVACPLNDEIHWLRDSFSSQEDKDSFFGEVADIMKQSGAEWCCLAIESEMVPGDEDSDLLMLDHQDPVEEQDVLVVMLLSKAWSLTEVWSPSEGGWTLISSGNQTQTSSKLDLVFQDERSVH